MRAVFSQHVFAGVHSCYCLDEVLALPGFLVHGLIRQLAVSALLPTGNWQSNSGCLCMCEARMCVEGVRSVCLEVAMVLKIVLGGRCHSRLYP